MAEAPRRSEGIGENIFGNIAALLGMLNRVPLVTLEMAVLGDGREQPCLLKVDPGALGITHPPRATRPQLRVLLDFVLGMAEGSGLLALLPPVYEGIPRINYVAVFIIFTAETPFPVYKLVTYP